MASRVPQFLFKPSPYTEEQGPAGATTQTSGSELWAGHIRLNLRNCFCVASIAVQSKGVLVFSRGLY